MGIIRTYKAHHSNQPFHPAAHKVKLPRLAINSNLNIDKDNFHKLIDLSRYIHNFQLYTSCEAYGRAAEYIRDGLNFSKFMEYIIRLHRETTHIQLHIMCTINALCLPTLIKFLDELIITRQGLLMYNLKEHMPSFTLNILRFPSFQSVLVLPKEMRLKYAEDLKFWLMKICLNHNKNKFIHEHEIEHINRLIEYLEQIDIPHNEVFDLNKCRKDFKTFYKQYDLRRGKNFTDSFPELAGWYATLG